MNSGAVVVESWADGIPVLQSDAVDPNLVVEEQNGYLFHREDIEELATKMVTACQNRSRLPKMGLADRLLVLEKFTYGNLIKTYETIYDKLIVGN